MELWTDVGLDAEKGRALEGHGDVLGRLLELCKEYRDHPTRVDFQEEWQAGRAERGRRREEAVGGSQSSVSSPSGVSPKGRKRTADEVRAIRSKLDQFRASLTQHVELMDRWDGKAKRTLVDRVVDAVGQWTARGSTAGAKKGQMKGQMKGQKKQPQPRRRKSSEDEDEDATDDDDDDDGGVGGGRRRGLRQSRGEGPQQGGGEGCQLRGVLKTTFRYHTHAGHRLHFSTECTHPYLVGR